MSTIWHAASAWYFLLPGLALWAVDISIRFTKSCEDVMVVDAKAIQMGDGGVTEIKFVMRQSLQSRLTDGGVIGPKSLQFEMGQYCFVNIPSVSLLEVHPFSLSSSSLDSVTSLHIRDMGRYSWTGRLFHHIQKCNNISDLQINVDGPYGLPFHYYSQYKSILLIAGGIGITPIHNILRTLLLIYGDGSSLQTKLIRVRLLWSIRDIEMVEIYRDTFEKILDHQITGGNNVKFELSIHCSISPSVHHHDDKKVDSTEKGIVNSSIDHRIIPIISNRMQMTKEIEALLKDGINESDTLVFVCGPDSMVKEATEVTSSLNIPFHAETFLL
jgi:NAD(P)H-flavin reductase